MIIAKKCILISYISNATHPPSQMNNYIDDFLLDNGIFLCVEAELQAFLSKGHDWNPSRNSFHLAC